MLTTLYHMRIMVFLAMAAFSGALILPGPLKASDNPSLSSPETQANLAIAMRINGEEVICYEYTTTSSTSRTYPSADDLTPEEKDALQTQKPELLDTFLPLLIGQTKPAGGGGPGTGPGTEIPGTNEKPGISPPASQEPTAPSKGPATDVPAKPVAAGCEVLYPNKTSRRFFFNAEGLLNRYVFRSASGAEELWERQGNSDIWFSHHRATGTVRSWIGKAHFNPDTGVYTRITGIPGVHEQVTKTVYYPDGTIKSGDAVTERDLQEAKVTPNASRLYCAPQFRVLDEPEKEPILTLPRLCQSHAPAAQPPKAAPKWDPRLDAIFPLHDDSAKARLTQIQNENPNLYRTILIRAFAHRLKSKIGKSDLAPLAAAAQAIEPDLAKLTEDYIKNPDTSKREKVIAQMNEKFFADQGAWLFLQTRQRLDIDGNPIPDAYIEEAVSYEIQTPSGFKTVTLDGKKIYLFFGRPSGPLYFDVDNEGTAGFQWPGSPAAFINVNDIAQSTRDLYYLYKDDPEKYHVSESLPADVQKQFAGPLKDYDAIHRTLFEQAFKSDKGMVDLQTVIKQSQENVSCNEMIHAFNSVEGRQEKNIRNHLEETASNLGQGAAVLQNPKYIYYNLSFHGALALHGSNNSEGIDSAKTLKILYETAQAQNLIPKDNLEKPLSEEPEWEKNWDKMDIGTRAATLTKWLKALGSLEPEPLRNLHAKAYERTFGHAPPTARITDGHYDTPLENLVRDAVLANLCRALNDTKFRDQLLTGNAYGVWFRLFGQDVVLTHGADRMILAAAARSYNSLNLAPPVGVIDFLEKNEKLLKENPPLFQTLVAGMIQHIMAGPGQVSRIP